MLIVQPPSPPRRLNETTPDAGYVICPEPRPPRALVWMVVANSVVSSFCLAAVAS